RGNLIFSGRGNEDVAGPEENLLRGQLFAFGEFWQGLSLRVNPVVELWRVDSFFVVETTMHVGGANDLVSGLLHQKGSLRADIPKTLDDHPAALTLHAEFGDCLVAAHYQAATSGFSAPLRSTQIERLARNDSSGRLPDVHRIRIHHPSHNLFVGADVRGRHVALRAKPVRQRRGVAPGDALEFGPREFRRIADDAAFRATEGNIHYSTFPGHPGSKSAHFVQGNVRRKPDPALPRSPNGGVQHTVAGENFDLTVIERHRNVNGNFAFGIFHVAVNALL